MAEERQAERSESGLVYGVGPEPARGMIIGEAPGAEEERRGVPFVGPSGVLLDTALEAAGGKRYDYWITNVYKFRPPGNRNPTRIEIAGHSQFLKVEFEAVQPEWVLILGKVARDWLYGGEADKPMAASRGIVGQWDENSPRLMFTWHPSYVLRGAKNAREEFFEDVALFVERTRD